MSTSGQRDDLVRQVALLESYCAANGWIYEVICVRWIRAQLP
ncbi:MAG: hypothetical protein ACYDHP_12460 [Ferrimicrobium sp.]